MHDLREPEDGILELVVEAVDEHENVALGPASNRAARPGRHFRALDRLGAEGNEIGRRISGERFRPLDGPRLTRRVRRDRDGQIGIGHRVAALAGEEHTAIARRLAGRRHQHLDPRCAGSIPVSAIGRSTPVGRPAQALKRVSVAARPTPKSLRCFPGYISNTAAPHPISIHARAR